MGIKPSFAAENVANWAVFCIIIPTDRLRAAYVVNGPLEKGLFQVAETQESIHEFIQS